MSVFKTFVIGLLASAALSSTAQASILVTYEGEAAGVENTTATFSFSAVETFDSFATGTAAKSLTQTFTSATNPATSITYNYTGAGGVQINNADQYGGAGGTGKYVVAFASTPYTLNLSSTNLAGGINYFGFWLSALDAGNTVQFYNSNNQVILTFDAQDALNVVTPQLNSGEYYGNPNSAFKGQDSGEPFIFLNFFDTTGTFSKIVFSETSGGGGYESDNHTIGNYTSMGQGTPIPLVNSVAGVPEPASWAMMLVGFGGMGMALRRRARRIAVG